MFEKVNPSHPDKVADRIAGALVDMAYNARIGQTDPHIAVEVLIGHGVCHIIAETDTPLDRAEIGKAVTRICRDVQVVDYKEELQDTHLAENQQNGVRCGDNGIFKGMPKTYEQMILTRTARGIYRCYQFDGKYILHDGRLIVCQSHAQVKDLLTLIDMTLHDFYDEDKVTINPLGWWSGGINVDTGATNRKLGSDMGDAVTGGGLHGKDLSKADVSVNIYAHLKAQKTGKPVELFCAIGDETVDGRPYSEIVEIARNFIQKKGGFEKFAEWGLI